MNPNCETCTVHNSHHLRRLGLDMGSFDFVVALAGNPNTGKSTVFNALTGLKQHTGNWPGKTVTRAEGGFAYGDKRYKLVDLPGTYSLLSTSVDEEVARDFILFGRPDVTVIVADATRLERNLNLILQILKITPRAVLALNLMDEARRHGVAIDDRALSRELGIPVVPMAARQGEGVPALLEMIHEVAGGSYVCKPRQVKNSNRRLDRAVRSLLEKTERLYPGLPNAEWLALRLLEGDQKIIEAFRDGSIRELARVEGETNGSAATEEATAVEALLSAARDLRWTVGDDIHDQLLKNIYGQATEIANKVLTHDGRQRYAWDQKLDRFLTGRRTGLPMMLILLSLVFWITIVGSNYPSAMLSSLLIDTLHPMLKNFAGGFLPPWLTGVLIDGMYLTSAWVVAVMLPPMAIFFPLFTLLEDFGYLPRIAFNLDGLFRKAGAHGKQALTMTMGYGCNAAGVVATRIIDSPRERLIAIITNNFSLCNGRWPTQILIASLFIGAVAPPALSGVVAAGAVIAVALLGIFFTFITSWGLSKTILRGEASAFSLELPPYRPPRFWQTLYTSLIDRTAIVLWRAVVFAMPAGAVIWLISNITIGDASLAEWFIRGLQPLGSLMGLNGVILLAFIVAIPANEIIIPTILMLTVLSLNLHGMGTGAGVLFEPDSLNSYMQLFQKADWTLLTAVNLMLFSLLHNPCSTTIYTIYKETRSWKWTMVSTLLPLALGFVVTFFVTQIARLIF